MRLAAAGEIGRWGTPKVDQERRAEQRRRTLKTGKIIFIDMNSVIDCVVRNQTEGGARLKVASVIGIPDEFLLKIMEAAPRRCQIVWRSEYELGIAFV